MHIFRYTLMIAAPDHIKLDEVDEALSIAVDDLPQHTDCTYYYKLADEIIFEDEEYENDAAWERCKQLCE